MFSNKPARRVPAGVVLAIGVFCATGAFGTTPNEMMETNWEVRALKAKIERATAQAELDKLGGGAPGAAATAAAAASKAATPDRTIDDGIVLLSVTGPSADPTYVVQMRGVQMPLKVGSEAMDGWVLESVSGNRMHLVHKSGKRVVERRSVYMTDSSYAIQREQQRLEAAKAATVQGGMQQPFPMMPQAPGVAVDKGITP